ncbi:MAG: response regulator [Hyphomicrobium sp.]
MPTPSHLLPEIRRTQVAMLYEQLPLGLAATLVNALLLSIILSEVVPTTLTSGWLSLIVIVSAGRMVLLKRFRSASATATSAEFELWHTRFFLGAAASALVWGLSGVLLFPTESYQHQAFIGFVLAGMAAGASGSMAADDRVFRCFLVVTVAPYMIRLALAGSPVNLAMATMCLAFIAALSVSSRKTSRVTTDALRLRYENRELLADLSETAEQLRAANVSLLSENSERRRTESELIEAKRAAEDAATTKTQFLANMSHEIRTPMNGVFGMTDLLMRTTLDVRQKKLVRTIHESAKSLLVIINDVLDLSRMEAGRMELDVHEFSLRDSVERASDLFVGQAHTKGIELSVFVDRDVPAVVKGDSGRLKQVLLNLIGNAVKFTSNGEVAVRVTCQNASETRARIAFEVRDTGIGIDAAMKAKLFEPFTQAESSISRRFGGTGLGLSISRHLVELMGGEMALDSQLGTGTTLTFTLDLEVGSRAAHAADYGDLTILDDARILVIDDRATNREIVSSYLGDAGAHIFSAERVCDAWAALVAALEAGKPYHAAVIDMMMPDQNGLDFTRRIKADPRLAATRIVLATSLNWDGDHAAMRDAGIEAIITKPIRRHDLISVTARAISGARHAGWRGVNARPDDDSGLHIASPVTLRIDADIILAEDNAVNIEVAKEYLSGFGCRVHVANNGLQAVAFAKTGSYDAILMDCQMPIMDGLTATRTVRAYEAETGKRRIPIIAVTANAFAVDRANAFAAGVDGYLSKPYSEDGLADVLRTWLAPKVLRDGPAAGAPLETRSDSSDVLHDDGGVPTPNTRDEASDVAADGPIDETMLAPLRRVRPDLLRRMLLTYLESAPVVLRELDVAVGLADFDAMSRVAHSLKSSSANLGAAALSDLCRSLELAADSRDGATCPIVAGQIRAGFADVSNALQRELVALDGRKSATAGDAVARHRQKHG